MNNYPVIWMHSGGLKMTSHISLSEIASSLSSIGDHKGRGLLTRVSKNMSNDLRLLGVGYVSAIGVDSCFLSKVTDNKNKVGTIG